MNKKRIKTVAIILLAGVLVCAAVLQYLNIFEMLINKNGVSIEGRLPVTDGFNEYDKTVDDTSFSYRINKNIHFDNKRDIGNIMLENPPENKYVLQFLFYVQGEIDNSPIYTSPMLEPNHYLKGDRLGKWLKSGEYDCAYIVRAYETSNLDKAVSEFVGAMTVTVG